MRVFVSQNRMGLPLFIGTEVRIPTSPEEMLKCSWARHWIPKIDGTPCMAALTMRICEEQSYGSEGFSIATKQSSIKDSWKIVSGNIFSFINTFVSFSLYNSISFHLRKYVGFFVDPISRKKSDSVEQTFCVRRHGTTVLKLWKFPGGWWIYHLCTNVAWTCVPLNSSYSMFIDNISTGGKGMDSRDGSFTRVMISTAFHPRGVPSPLIPPQL